MKKSSGVTFAEVDRRVSITSILWVLSIAGLFIGVWILGWDAVTSVSSPWILISITCVVVSAFAVHALWKMMAARDAWYASRQCRHLTRLMVMRTSEYSQAERETLLALLRVSAIGLRTQFTVFDIDAARLTVSDINVARHTGTSSGNSFDFFNGLASLMKKGVVQFEEGVYFFAGDFANSVPDPPGYLKISELRSE